MSLQLILPPEYPECSKPIVFLAGPIGGAPDWQSNAIQWFQNHGTDIAVASPRKEYHKGEYIFEKQVDWETHYLRKASQNGVILFWLALEQAHSCDRPFAQTSRFELGEWKSKHEQTDCKLVVGIEQGFSNSEYIQRRLSQDCPNIPVCQSLEETCAKTIELLRI